MFQAVEVMLVKFLISAAGWTRILKDLTHHLEGLFRCELTEQERWPKAKQQAFMATAHLSLQALVPPWLEPHPDTFPTKTLCTPQ